MKRLISNLSKILPLIISLILFSCSNDDNDISFEYSVIGVWEITYVEAHSSLGDDTIKDMIKVGDRVTINQDGTYEIPEEVGKWKQDGNKLTFYPQSNNDDGYISVPAIMEISKLTDKELDMFLNYGNGLIEYDLKLKRIE